MTRLISFVAMVAVFVGCSGKASADFPTNTPGVVILDWDPEVPSGFDDMSVMFGWWELPSDAAIRMDVYKLDSNSVYQPYYADVVFNVSPSTGTATFPAFMLGGVGCYKIRVWSSVPGAWDDIDYFVAN